MNKIISFSLYGSNNKYCIGMIENIEIIKKSYSDWKIYVYYNNIPDKIYNKIKEYGCKLIKCEQKTKWEGMFWRFYPFNDNSIDIWLSRDSDSRISKREMNLVEEWINSDKPFHIIRDHKQHKIEILGGTFGVKNKFFQNIDIKKYIEIYRKKYKKNTKKFRDADQYFLRKEIWPLIKNNHMAHISWKHLKYTDNDILIKRDTNNNFIGKDIDIKDIHIKLH